MSDLKNRWAGSLDPQHAQNYRISKSALYDFSLITYWGPWPYCKKKKNLYEKNLYNPESIGTLKSPWKLVTNVIALSLPDLIKILTLWFMFYS